jgi:hypothetical protein
MHRSLRSIGLLCCLCTAPKPVDTCKVPTRVTASDDSTTND